jgi:hypothetical protein
MKPIQKNVRRSPADGGPGPAFRNPKQIGMRIAHARASRRKAKVTGPTSSTASRIAT